MLKYTLSVSIFLVNIISIWYNKGGSTILTLKNDYLFKALFTKSGNENLLKDFLESILKEKIGEITVQKDASLEKSTLDEKLGILDLCIKQENRRILNIEMQVVNEYNVEDRALYYASRLIGSQLKKGESYQNLKPVIVIFILDFEFISFQEYITNVIMVAEKHREFTMIPKLKFQFIELPKFRKLQKKNMNQKLAQWLSFIDGENKEMVQMAIQKNKVIKKANAEWEYLTGNAEKRRLAELREKYLKDEANIRSGARAEGIKIGKELGEKAGMELGKKAGMELGKKAGMELGKKAGMELGKKVGIELGEKAGMELGEKIAREKMLEQLLQYDIDIAKIAQVTNISENEIKRRKNK